MTGGGSERTKAASDFFYPLTAPASQGALSNMLRETVCTLLQQLHSWMNQLGACACLPSPPKSHTLENRVCSFLHPQHSFTVITLTLIQGLSTFAHEGPSPVSCSVVCATAPRNLPPDSSLISRGTKPYTKMLLRLMQKQSVLSRMKRSQHFYFVQIRS